MKEAHSSAVEKSEDIPAEANGSIAALRGGPGIPLSLPTLACCI